MFHIFNLNGRKVIIDTLLKNTPTIWNVLLSNGIGRLTQGILTIIGNDAMEFL